MAFKEGPRRRQAQTAATRIKRNVFLVFDLKDKLLLLNQQMPRQTHRTQARFTCRYRYRWSSAFRYEWVEAPPRREPQERKPKKHHACMQIALEERRTF